MNNTGLIIWIISGFLCNENNRDVSYEYKDSGFILSNFTLFVFYPENWVNQTVHPLSCDSNLSVVNITTQGKIHFHLNASKQSR